VTHASLRARAALGISVPLSQRLKWRLVLAITNALLRPTRSMAVLRRTVLVAVAQLRRAGVDDDQIRAALATLVEDVARERAIDASSLLTGAPRWVELIARVDEWISIAG
jgi:hypothetical protein